MMELQDARRQEAEKLENEISELNRELTALEQTTAEQGEALAKVNLSLLYFTCNLLGCKLSEYANTKLPW